ncbi:MAG: Flp pilus assembly complex ATPase component TadA [Elusimicrobia bacterium]|nr:Flp pilus assembly complex ATPase component TadA [Elusimicrobiota bacterium]
MSIRFRVDGDLREVLTLDHAKCVKLIARYKFLGNMDLAEKRKPQDGSFEFVVQNKTIVLRLATSLTPYGESLIIRVLEPWTKPRTLEELGMADHQVQHMLEFAKMRQGLILIVGPTGAGKTTTLYSLFSQIDCKTRSLISVEYPVEYRIPHAKQQQVNEKVGITFESLLKSAVRQDPDILFLGETRDPYSAKMALDFASTGHLTLTTMHTANATSAIFRLERLGITRENMSDTILGIVAQQLVKKLCADCKKLTELTSEESKIFSLFMNDLPQQVAQPVGCVKCGNTGYFGRVGIYEVVRFYPQISAMIRRNEPIPEIRKFAKERGDYMIGQHALEKVKELLISPRDIISSILADEEEYHQMAVSTKRSQVSVSDEQKSGNSPKPNSEDPQKLSRKPLKSSSKPEGVPNLGGRSTSPFLEEELTNRYSILVVDDDEDTRQVIEKFLTLRDYVVTVAVDGVEALALLKKEKYDLILSDIEMPNMDGFELMEMKAEKGIPTPVIFFTGKSDPEHEKAGLTLGAEDYIKKPISKEVLLLRIEHVLKRHPK